MKYFLTVINLNWADEIDLEFIETSTSKGIEKITIAAEWLDKTLEDSSINIYVGSNQYIEFRSYTEAIKSYSHTEITKEQYEFLKSIVIPKLNSRNPMDYIWDSAYDKLYKQDKTEKLYEEYERLWE